MAESGGDLLLKWRFQGKDLTCLSWRLRIYERGGSTSLPRSLPEVTTMFCRGASGLMHLQVYVSVCALRRCIRTEYLARR